MEEEEKEKSVLHIKIVLLLLLFSVLNGGEGLSGSMRMRATCVPLTILASHQREQKYLSACCKHGRPGQRSPANFGAGFGDD